MKHLGHNGVEVGHHKYMRFHKIGGDCQDDHTKKAAFAAFLFQEIIAILLNHYSLCKPRPCF